MSFRIALVCLLVVSLGATLVGCAESLTEPVATVPGEGALLVAEPGAGVVAHRTGGELRGVAVPTVTVIDHRIQPGHTLDVYSSAIGRVRDALRGTPVASDVCVPEADRCTRTDVDGAFEILGLPADEPLTLVYTPDDPEYPSYRVMLAPGPARPEVSLRLMQRTFAESIAQQLGVQWDEGMGMVIATSRATPADERFQGREGTVMSIEGAAPTYMGMAGFPNPFLEATGANGNAIFMNVEPGLHTVVFDVSDVERCVPFHAWPEELPDDCREDDAGCDEPAGLAGIEVMPGEVTFVSMHCE